MTEKLESGARTALTLKFTPDSADLAATESPVARLISRLR